MADLQHIALVQIFKNVGTRIEIIPQISVGKWNKKEERIDLA